MRYLLAEACQNTFVLFDCLAVSFVEESFLQHVHRSLEKEERDDALILVDGRSEAGVFYARMLVLGRDGMMGEFCGNGALACAAYLFERYSHYTQFYIVSPRGAHLLQKHSDGECTITLPPVCLEWNEKFISNLAHFRNKYDFTYVEAIEPHLVVMSEMSDAQLFSLGRELNAQRDLFPMGININSCSVLGQGRISVKTYERGVQRLTRSCGSGSVACASHCASEGTLRVETPGGVLHVTLNQEHIALKGLGLII